MITEDLNLNNDDLKKIIFLTIFSTILVSYYIVFNENLGIYCSDVFVYLLNALYYTGTNIHSSTNIYLSPVICFLTSILFRLGLVDKLAIYIVTGIFAILGNIGLYLLLRLRFDDLLSLTGAIIYSTLALNLTWLANGTLDIPAVGVTIWLILFVILAMKKNPKYYVYVIPIFVIGFFTRYSVIFMIPIIVAYYLYENSFKIDKNDLKYILKGLGIGIILSAVILATISMMGRGHLGFIGSIVGGAQGTLGSTSDPAYNTDVLYYLANLANFISSSNTTFAGKTPELSDATSLAWITFAILILGGIIWTKKENFKIDSTKIIGIIICLIALITFNRFSSVVTITITLLGLFLIGKDSDNKLGFLMLSWILVYVIFNSYYPIKVNRYIIPIFPALTYFIIVAVEIIDDKIKYKKVLPIILIALFMIQGFAFTFTFEQTDEFIATEDISNYIISNTDDLDSIDIGVYNIRPYSWYLNTSVIGIPTRNIEKIENSNVSYYISNKQLDLKNYSEIKNINFIYLYEKNQ